MSTHRLDTAKLLRDVDRARRRGAPDEISYREVSRAIDVAPTMFTRLAAGGRPDCDSLLSLLMWLNPKVSLAEYALPGDGPRRKPAMRRAKPPTAPVKS